MHTTTEIPDICPVCQTLNQPSDTFCSKCGKQLHESVLSTTLSKQIIIYLVSFFLTPFGLWWGIKYLRSPDKKAKTVGIVSVVVTVLALILSAALIGSIMNSVNSQLNTNIEQYNSLGI